jgi:hypothetical protein
MRYVTHHLLFERHPVLHRGLTLSPPQSVPSVHGQGTSFFVADPIHHTSLPLGHSTFQERC